MALTHFAIESAKPKDKPYKLSDGEGLHLLIQPSGAKWWRFRYQFDRKEKMLSLGTFPDVSLAQARERRNDARKLVAEGIDPSVQRKADKVAAAVAADNTFGAVAADYLKKLEDEGKAPVTIDKNRWLLEDLAKPLAKRPIADIKPAEILAILKAVEKTGARETARRLRGTIGSVFRFAIANLRAETDPTYALRGALLQPIVRHRSAITDEAQFGELLRAIHDYKAGPVRAAILFMTLTLCRPGEARLMRKPEVNWLKATWNIPAERMKMRREFQIPLSRQALGVLRTVWETSEELVFPSPFSRRKPMSENTMNKALRHMGYSGDVHVAHGFRSSASTILNERRVADPEVIEVALAHQDDDAVRRAYNRAQYWPERVKLLQDWADLIDQFRTLQPAANLA